MDSPKLPARSRSRSRKRGSYPNLHQLSSIRPLRPVEVRSGDPSGGGEAASGYSPRSKQDAPQNPRQRSYLDVKTAPTTPSSLSRSNSTARLRNATATAMSSIKSTSRSPAYSPDGSFPASPTSPNHKSISRKKKKGKRRASDQETPYFLQRVGSAVGLDLREGTEIGSAWLEEGNKSGIDLQAYTRHQPDDEDFSSDVRVYRPEPKPMSSRPISRTNSQVPSRVHTRHHSRHPTATLSPQEEKESGMFTLSRPQTRSSATSGGSGMDSSPDFYKDMLPDFMNKDDRAYYERLQREAREEEESGVTSDDPEDDEEIRRIKEGKGRLGIEKIVDRMVGVTLFDPDEEDEDVRVRERRDLKAAAQVQDSQKEKQKKPPPEGWTNPAWILSFAAKVVL